MVSRSTPGAGPRRTAPSGRGLSRGGCAARVLLVTDTDPRLDGFARRAADLGAVVLRHPGPVISTCPLGDDDLVAQLDRYVSGEGTRDLILCGHSPGAAAEPGVTAPGPAGVDFLTRTLTRMAAAKRTADQAREAVLRYAENLLTYPTVRTGVALGRLRMHAWFYVAEAGSVLGYDPQTGWVPLGGGRTALTGIGEFV